MRKHIHTKKKIAIIGAKGMPSRVDGLEVYIDIICSGLAKEYDITIFCRKRYCDEIVHNYKGLKIVHVPSINTKHLDAVTYGFFATLIALINGYDLFWYQAMGSAIMEWIPRLFRKKILSTIHGLDWKRERFGKISSKMVRMGEWSIAKCADIIIVLNQNDKQYFKDKWNRECEIISNGSYNNEKKQARLIKQLYGLEEDSYFLFASRISPEKDVKCLIRAYIKTNTTIKLVIAGGTTHTGQYVDEVHDLAKEDKRIIFTGHVLGELLEELYSNAYAYILPSTIEGQSIGLLEAMGYGLPCIVSDIPENVAVIRDVGIIFRTGNVSSLKEKLEYVIYNGMEAKRLGNLAKERTKNYYNWDETIKKTQLVILNLFNAI